MSESRPRLKTFPLAHSNALDSRNMKDNRGLQIANRSFKFSNTDTNINQQSSVDANQKSSLAKITHGSYNLGNSIGGAVRNLPNNDSLTTHEIIKHEKKNQIKPGNSTHAKNTLDNRHSLINPI